MKLRCALCETNILLNLCFYYLSTILHSYTGYPTLCRVVLRAHSDQTLSEETFITRLMIYLNVPFLGHQNYFSNFYYNYCILCLCMYEGKERNTIVPVWKPGHNFQESIFFFLHVGPGNRTHAIRLDSKCLYPPSCLAHQDVKINGFIRLNVIMMIIDIYWAVAVGELSSFPALSIWVLQSVLWIGNFIFISLHLMQMKNETQGNCVISHRSHIARLQGTGSQMNKSYVWIITAFQHHHIT